MASEGLDIIRCECCGAVVHVSVASKRRWCLRRCKRCGLVFVWPQPSAEEVKSIYSMSKGYFRTAEADLKKTSQSYPIHLNNLLRAVGLSHGKLLDVGCSTGKVIFHMRKLGWSVMGCDLNAEAVEVATANGLDVRFGTLEDFIDIEEAFDVINMSDVLEHVLSPNNELQAVYRVLKPGGLLVLRTPNVDCSFASSTLLLARITGLPWPHSEAPYHLFEFSPKAIREVLQRNRFKPVIFTTSGKVPFIYTVGATGFFDDLKTKMKCKGHYAFCWEIIPYLPLLAAVALLLFPFWAYGQVADRIRNTGNSMTVIAYRL